MVSIQEPFSTTRPSPHGEVERSIKVKNDFIGFHAYEAAPDQVAFLKARHRHKFYVESTVQVFHDDRELEFFMVQELIERHIIPFVVSQEGGLGSCEMIAEDILWGLVNTYGDHRFVFVEVSEDKENSGRAAWNPNY